MFLTDARRSLEGLMRTFREVRSKDPLDAHKLLLCWCGIRALSRLVELDDVERETLENLQRAVKKPYGISDAIRGVLLLAEKELTPMEVRQGLEELNFDMRKYSFPMGNVHNTIKRLVKRGEVTARIQGDGSTLYAWNHGRVGGLALRNIHLD